MDFNNIFMVSPVVKLPVKVTAKRYKLGLLKLLYLESKLVLYCHIFSYFTPTLLKMATLQLSSLTGGGRPLVPVHALFQRLVTEPPTFFKLPGLIFLT
jgi:hypothetical protein